MGALQNGEEEIEDDDEDESSSSSETFGWFVVVCLKQLASGRCLQYHVV